MTGVCVLTYNSADKIGACLHALEAALDPGDRITVVDNASMDDSVARAKQANTRAEVVRNNANLGYSAGNNVGIEHLLAQGCDFIALINPDVEVRPDTLSRLRAALATSPTAGCAGGVGVVDGKPSGRAFRNRPEFLDMVIIYNSFRYLPILRTLFAPFYRWRCAHHYIRAEQLRLGGEIGAASGACILFAAHALRHINGLDARSFLYFEEFMVADSLRTANFTVVAAPEALYSHQEGSSSGTITLDRTLPHFAHSEQVYFREYRGWRVRALLLRALRRLELVAWRTIKALRG